MQTFTKEAALRVIVSSLLAHVNVSLAHVSRLQWTLAESPDPGDCTTSADCWNPRRSKRGNARAPRTNEERHRTTWRQMLDLRGSRLSGGRHPVQTQPLAASMSAAAFDAE